ncbi:MAG: site-2 protease family protein [Candidatus Aenigmatarchaeota archaeon]
MDLYLISVFAFFAVLAALLIIDRKNIEVNNYVLFMRRTQKGRGLIDRIASWNEKFWNNVGFVSVAVGVIGMVFAFVFIGYIFSQQLIGPPTAEGPALVLPSLSGETTASPGVVAVPFWEWIISILVLVGVHEGMHGIMVKNVKSRIKSLGLALFVVIPGAFVEPDEEDLQKKSWIDQIKVYSAGSFANFCLAAFVFLFLTYVFLPAFALQGIGFVGYVNATEYDVQSFPAEEVNLTSPIMSIDGQRTRDYNEFSEVIRRYSPGDTVQVESPESSYSLKLAENPEDPESPFLGIAGGSETHILKGRYQETLSGSFLNFLRSLLSWIFVLNIGIGIMNLLPLKPLDGGLILETISEKFYPDKSEYIVRGVSTAALLLLLTTLAISFLG